MSKSLQPPASLCEQTQEAILALLDNELAPQQQAVLAEHLPNCPACQAYQESMQHLTLSLRKLESVPVPANLENRIIARLAAENNKPAGPVEADNAVQSATPNAGSARSNFPRKASSWPKLVPVAAALLTVAVSLPLIYQSISPDTSILETLRSGLNLAQTASQANQQNKPGTPIANSIRPAFTTDAVTTEGVTDTLSSKPENGTDALSNSSATAAKGASTEDHPASVKTTPEEVASALPSPINVENTYASSKEGDIYFDPLSSVVDF